MTDEKSGKHAIMVIGHGTDASILQATINHFDGEMFDFFIHWDKKYALPKLNASKSKIIYAEDRIPVYWGTSSQVCVEKKLMSLVYKTGSYAYVHLISSVDIPLMTKDYFLNYFMDDFYLGFTEKSAEDYRRVSYYYPIDKMNIRSKIGRQYIRMIRMINAICGIDRLKNKKINIQKGSNWFSMKGKYLEQAVKYKHMDIFKHAYLADELYLQTIFADYKPDNIGDDNEMSARYIDWTRGEPYVFTMDDVEELRKKVNTKYAFARKAADAGLVKKIFEE